MKKEELNKNLLKGLLIGTAIAVAALPGSAFAGGAGVTDLNSEAANMLNEEQNIPDILSAFFYIAGTCIAGTGLWLLKQHADNPAGVPMGKGVGRLAIGGAMLLIPFAANAFTQTVLNNGTASGYTKFHTVM